MRTHPCRRSSSDNRTQIMNQLVTFDTILTNKVGFGLYQIRTIAVVGLAMCLNGFTEYYQLQTLEVLRNQKDYDQEDLEYLSSAQFLGMTVGYLLQSVIIDVIGRRGTFIGSEFLSGTMLIVLGTSNGMGEQIAIRFILGMLFAMIDTAGNPLVCEVVPASIRGTTLSIMTFAFILGVFLNGVGCLIFWDDVDSGNISTLFYIAGAIQILGSLAAVVLLRESPRFLMSKQDFESGFTELNLMGFVNRQATYTPISNEEERELKLQFKPINDEAPNFLNLFDLDVRRATFVLWTLLILQNIMDKGFIVIMPFILKDSKQTLSELPIFNTLEFLSPVVAFLLIDRKSFGRKRGLQIGYVICLGAFIVMYRYMAESVVFCITLQRFAQRLTWTFLNVLSMESYNTRIRTLGFGIAQCIGKCAGTIAPFMFIPLYFYHEQLPYLVLAVIALVNGFFVDLLPSELTQQPLDFKVPAPKDQFQDLVNEKPQPQPQPKPKMDE